MEFYHFSELPYPYLPKDLMETYGSYRVVLDNKVIDPRNLADLYEMYMEQYEYADELGFNLMFNEHHQTATCLNPQPSIPAASIIRRTKNSKICILGYPLPHRGNPLRVAEEVAMLDVMSRGRIECGFVPGVGMEVHPSNVKPSEIKDRYYEAHDLVKKAWTSQEVFSWEGKYYHYRFVNPFPRPYQEPHPPIWITLGSNIDQIRWAAENQYTCAVFLAGFKVLDKLFNYYREYSKEAGFPEPGPEKVAYLALTYTAETDELAEKEGKDLLWYLYTREPHWFRTPPGLRSVDYRKDIYRPKKGGFNPKTATWEELNEKGIIISGSPDTVAKKMRKLYEEKGVGKMLMMNHAGLLPDDKVKKSLRLFSKEVMPQLEDLKSSLQQGNEVKL